MRRAVVGHHQRSYTAPATSFTITDFAELVRGDTLDFQDDGTYDLFIVDATPTNSTVTVGISYDGATNANHANAARYYKSPRYPSKNIVAALTHVVNTRLWPELWVVLDLVHHGGPDDHEPVRPATDFLATLNDKEYLYQAASGSIEDVLYSYGTVRQVPTSVSTSGWAHAGDEVARVDVNATLFYRAKVTTSNMTSMMEPVIAVGTAAYLLSTEAAEKSDRFDEDDRTWSDAADLARAVAAVRPGEAEDRQDPVRHLRQAPGPVQEAALRMSPTRTGPSQLAPTSRSGPTTSASTRTPRFRSAGSPTRSCSHAPTCPACREPSTSSGTCGCGRCRTSSGVRAGRSSTPAILSALPRSSRPTAGWMCGCVGSSRCTPTSSWSRTLQVVGRLRPPRSGTTARLPDGGEFTTVGWAHPTYGVGPNGNRVRLDLGDRSELRLVTPGTDVVQRDGARLVQARTKQSNLRVSGASSRSGTTPTRPRSVRHEQAAGQGERARHHAARVHRGCWQDLPLPGLERGEPGNNTIQLGTVTEQVRMGRDLLHRRTSEPSNSASRTLSGV